MSLAEEYNIPVVEDEALAIDGFYKSARWAESDVVNILIS